MSLCFLCSSKVTGVTNSKTFSGQVNIEVTGGHQRLNVLELVTYITFEPRNIET